jgi:hypothetical protein
MPILTFFVGLPPAASAKQPSGSTRSLGTYSFMDVSEAYWRYKGAKDDPHKHPRLGDYGD